MERSNYLVTGNDAATIEIEARKIVRSEAGENPDPTAFELFRERDGMEGAAVLCEGISALLSPPFFGARKTVWLHYAPGFAAEGAARGPRAAEAKAIQRLAEVIGAGLPPGIVLILSGPDADTGKELGSACRRAGQVIEFRRPEFKDRHWQRDMVALIRDRAKGKRLTLSDEAAYFLVDAIGTDTAKIEPELEKLACYTADPGRTVTIEDVQSICHGDGEANTWTLLDAIGERRTDDTLRQIQILTARDRDADDRVLMLLKSITGHFRSMLQLRVFLQNHRQVRTAAQLRNLVQGLSAETKAAALEQGFDVIALHPFRLQKILPQALNYSGAELVKALPKLRDVYWKCVSGAVSGKRVALENALVQLTGRP